MGRLLCLGFALVACCGSKQKLTNTQQPSPAAAAEKQAGVLPSRGAIQGDGGAAPADGNSVGVMTYPSSAGILPSLAQAEGVLHMVWVGGGNIVYRQSRDGGGTWTEEQVIAPIHDRVNHGIRPSVVASGQFVYVAWAGHRGYQFSGSTNGGTTWSAPSELGSGISGALAAGGNGRAFWLLADEQGLWCREWSSNGAWTPTVRVAQLEPGWARVAVASTAAGLHVVFWNLPMADPIERIRYTRSEQGCRGWKALVDLAPARNLGTRLQDIGEPSPAIAVSGQRAYVIWSEVPRPRNGPVYEPLLFRSSSDLGSHWGPITTLETAGGRPGRLKARALVSTGLALRVISNLGYFASADGGDSWSKIRPDWAGEAIAADSKNTCIVGTEVDAGRSRIFMMRIPSESAGKP